MPRLQNRIGGDEHGQVVRVKVVIDIGKAAAFKPLADDKSVRLENRRLLRVEPEVVQTSILIRVRGVPDGGINAEEIPELCCGWIERDLGQVLIGGLIDRNET